MRVPHEPLHGLQIISVIQKGRPECVPHDMRMNPLLNHGLFYHGSDQVVNRFLMRVAIQTLQRSRRAEKSERVASADGLGRGVRRDREGDDPDGLFLGIKKIGLPPQ